MSNSEINNEIKYLIINGTTQMCTLITLWGLTNYYDNAYNKETTICTIGFLGGRITITNKYFYQVAFLTSVGICTCNLLK